MIWETTSKALTLKDNAGRIKVEVGVFKRGLFRGKQIWGMMPADFVTVIGYLRNRVNELKTQYVDTVKAHYRIDKNLNAEKVELNRLQNVLAQAQANYDAQAAKVTRLQREHDNDYNTTVAAEQGIIDELNTMAQNALDECYFHSGEGLYLYDKQFNYLGKYSVQNPNVVDNTVQPPAEWLLDYTLPSEGAIKAEVDNE